MDPQVRTEQRQPPAEPAARGEVSARDSGLRRIGHLNRWLVGGAVGLSGLFSAVAALAHPGSSQRGASPPVPAGTTAAAAPTPTDTTSAPAPADPTQSADPAAGAVDPSAGAGSAQPLPPQAAPQADPTPIAPPAAASGGS